MDNLSVKKLLKQCKEEIHAKKYDDVIDLCKLVLRKDRSNYLAHVYLGYTYTELQDRVNALSLYKRACKLDKAPILALYGLERFFHICTDKNSKLELLNIYKEILKYETIIGKIKDVTDKLRRLANDINEQESTAVFLKNECIEKALEIDSNASVTHFWYAIAFLISKLDNVPDYLSVTYEKALKEGLQDRNNATFDLYIKYLQILYKNENYEELLDNAIKLTEVHDKRSIAMEWALKTYSEMIICEVDSSILNKFRSKIFEISSTLTNINSESTKLSFFVALMKYQNSEFIEARNNLEELIQKKIEWIFPWYLLLECQNRLCCFDQGAKIAAKIGKMQEFFVTNTIFCQKLILAQIFAMTRTTNKNLLNYGINLCETALEKYLLSVNQCLLIYTSRINGLILLNDFDNADIFAKEISDGDYSLFQIRMLRIKYNYNQALELIDKVLEKNNKCYEIWLERGLIYWSLNDFDSAINSFLKAAKYQPSCYEGFYYLGQIYELKNDLDKAKRCLQKAVMLNPYSFELGMVLSRIYRKSKEWSMNLALLEFYVVNQKKYLFDESEDVDLLWAWRQLGFHYLEKSDFDLAAENFRKILRVNPNHSDTLESLADAYLGRESYTSALKSYELAAQITQKSIYSFLQLGFIKMKLCEYDFAYVYFKYVLDKNDKYVPALKGLAETCLKQAQYEFGEHMFGTSQEKAQEAIDFIIMALKENSSFQCLWKIAADCCLFTTNFNEAMATLTLKVNYNNNNIVRLNKKDLFEKAIKFYSRAISLKNSNINLWHDLSVCFFKYANYLKSVQQLNDETRLLFEKSLKIAKFCVQNDQINSTYWNFLGIIAASEGVKEYGLAQHAFINALNLDQNSCQAWSNLGVLYFHLNKIKLANDAFSRAQCIDPNFLNCWVGQALLAEKLDHKECMDLFRHSSQLGFHPENALGYAMSVCKKLQTLDSDTIVYSIHNMYAVQVACDNLSWYSELYPNNVTSWNMLGILNEHQKNYKKAIICYEIAESLINSETNQSEIDCILMNCARINCILKNYEKAVDYYKDITNIHLYVDYDFESETSQNLKDLNVHIACGFSFALFMLGNYDYAYKLYESVLKWLFSIEKDTNEATKSQVCIALAAITYKLNNLEETETFLFQSIQFRPSAIQGLFASWAFGLLTKNFELAELVTKELENMVCLGNEIINYPVLKSYTTLLSHNDYNDTINILISGFYNYPFCGKLLLMIALICYQIKTDKLLRLGISFISIALSMDKSNIDLGFCYRLLTQSNLLLGNTKIALIYAQKALIYFPNDVENWKNLKEVIEDQSDMNIDIHNQLLMNIDFILNLDKMDNLF